MLRFKQIIFGARLKWMGSHFEYQTVMTGGLFEKIFAFDNLLIVILR